MATAIAIAMELNIPKIKRFECVPWNMNECYANDLCHAAKAKAPKFNSEIELHNWIGKKSLAISNPWTKNSKKAFLESFVETNAEKLKWNIIYLGLHEILKPKRKHMAEEKKWIQDSQNTKRWWCVRLEHVRAGRFLPLFFFIRFQSPVKEKKPVWKCLPVNHNGSPTAW